MSDLPKYAHYKDSGVEWLGKIPSHWKVIRLKFLGDIILGLTYSPEDVTSNGGTLVFRSSNVQNGLLTFDDNIYVDKDIPKKIITTENDILICSRNGSKNLIGKNALINEKGIGQTFGAFMTVFRTPYPKYVYYLLNSELFKYQIGSFLTSTINQLTTYVLGNFKICFPQLEEQKAIVSFLDKKIAQIDTLISKQEMLLEKLAEQRIALISNAVTKGINPDVEMKESGIEWLGEIPSHWQVRQLKFATTCNDETLNETTEPEKEILYVDISSVSLTEGIKHKECMAFENSPSRARRIVKDGDIIISTVRTYLKAITQIRNAEENLVVSTGFAVLRYKPEIVPNFLGYWVQSNGFIGSIVANSVGVSYPAINTTDLIRLPIVILPKKEQKAIVSFLNKKIDKINCTELSLYDCITKLKEYRSALITQAVTGKIDVRNLNQ